MKKNVVIGVVVALVLVAGVVVFVAGGKDNDTSNSSATASSDSDKSSFKQLDACTLFTEADAKALMGESATASDTTPATTSEDVTITDCSYSNNATVVKDIRLITVTSRSPLTQAGADSNKAMFAEQRPSTAQAVTGYGDAAYWDPTTHQMAILKNDSWIAITYGSTNPANSTLEDAKLVADKIVAKQ